MSKKKTEVSGKPKLKPWLNTEVDHDTKCFEQLLISATQAHISDSSCKVLDEPLGPTWG